MKRAVFKLKDGEFINVPADQIDKQGEWICAWQGDDIVAIAKADIVETCRLSEEGEVKK